MKISKRIVSLSAAIAMAASLFAAPVSASAADVEKIGLSVNNADDRQVFVKDGEVWAFSHPWHGSWQFTNYVLYATRLASANGYTMRVTDRSYTQLDGNAQVKGDTLLRAVKDSETLYIPIVDQVEDAAATGINQNIFGGYKPNKTYLKENVSGAFGRGFDETALVFEMPANADTPQGSRTEYKFESDPGDLTEANAPITTEISVYFDGEASVSICKDGGNELLKIAKDGKLSYIKQDQTNDTGVVLEKGKWHRIAISVDKPKGDYSTLWIDGVMYQYLGFHSKLPTQLRFGAASDCGEGNIAFADPRVYYGYYNSAYDVVNVTGESADVTIKNSKIIYNDAAIDTADSLKAEIMKITDARDVKVYENADKAAFGLGAESVVAIVPRSGGIPAEYTVEGTATPFQKIGLEISDKYTKGFHHLKSTENVDNYYVKKLTEEIDGAYVDKLVVFNNANQIEYTSFGWKVLDALSSTKGYTLSIWNSEKQIERSVPNEQVVEDGKTVVRGARTQEVVTDGDWLKAEKGDEVIWIPIIDKIEKMKVDDISSLGGYNNGNVPGANIGSLAGKSADDVAYAFVTNNNANEGRYQMQGGELANYLSGGVYTYVMNVYADEKATAQLIPIASGSWLYTFVWNSDGSYIINNNSAITGTLERGKWHRVAITLDVGRGQLQVFVDGENKTISGGATKTLDRIDLRVAAGSTGTVAYDDLRVYEGYYDASEDLVDFKTSGVSISDGVIRIVENTDIETAKQTIAAELPGASLSEYGDGYLLVTPSKSYHYLTTEEYAVNGFGFAEDNIVFAEKDGKLTVSTVFAVEYPEAMLYLAEYDSDGRLVNVTSDDAGEEGIPSVTVAVTEGNSYKAFLWLTNEDYKIVPISLAK